MNKSSALDLLQRSRKSNIIPLKETTIIIADCVYTKIRLQFLVIYIFIFL